MNYLKFRQKLIAISFAILCLAYYHKALASDDIKWQLDKVSNGVAFYHAIQNCNGTQVVFLKLVNNNKYSVKATWDEVYSARNNNNQLEQHSGQKQITLGKGVLYVSNCNEKLNRKLLISSSDVSPTHKVEIETYNFSNISISKIK